MNLMQSEFLPMTIGVCFLLIAGFWELKTWRVPNALTFSAIIAAFVFVVIAGAVAPERNGTLFTAFMGMLIGFALMLPHYVGGYLGAGCVKAQAAFGAWVGAGLSGWPSFMFVAYGTIGAGIVLSIVQKYRLSKMAENDEPQEFHAQLPISLGAALGLAFAFARLTYL